MTQEEFEGLGLTCIQVTFSNLRALFKNQIGQASPFIIRLMGVARNEGTHEHVPLLDTELIPINRLQIGEYFRIFRDSERSVTSWYRVVEDEMTGSSKKAHKSHRDRIQELECALAFYADPETYFAVGFFPDPPCGDFMEDFSELEHHGWKPGKLARFILGIDLPTKERE